MADELKYYGKLDETGLAVIAKVFDSLGSQVGGDVSLTETGTSAIYIGDMVTASAGEYGVRVIDSGSGDLLGQGTIKWDGTEEVEILGVIDAVSKYPEGRIYYDDSNGSAGQVYGVNGTFDNPCSDWDDVVALASQYGLTIESLGSVVEPTGSVSLLTIIGNQRDGEFTNNYNYSGVIIKNFGEINIEVNAFIICVIEDTVVGAFDVVAANVSFNAKRVAFNAYPTAAHDGIIEESEFNLNSTWDTNILTRYIRCSFNNPTLKTNGTIRVYDCHGDITIPASAGGNYVITGGSGRITILSGSTATINVSGRNPDAVIDNSGGTATVNIEDARGGGGVSTDVNVVSVAGDDVTIDDFNPPTIT